MTSTLTTAALAECESVIERGLGTFVEVGAALLRIRNERLYRESHGTFEDYCRDRWALKRQRAYELMEAADVASVVSEISDTPVLRESHAAELAPLRHEPDAMREAWTEAVEQHGPKPTAAQVREVVQERIEPTPAPVNPEDVITVERPPAAPDPAPIERMAVHYSSATDEWATPQDFFDAVAREFDFTTDVCALDSSAKCEHYYTPETDGLAQDWTGTCWMNPPYGRAIVDWVRKAHESAQAGATVVALVPARVDTGWWWDYCRHAEVRFLRGRLRFGDDDSAGAPFPSVLVIFGRPACVKWWEWR